MPTSPVKVWLGPLGTAIRIGRGCNKHMDYIVSGLKAYLPYGYYGRARDEEDTSSVMGS